MERDTAFAVSLLAYPDIFGTERKPPPPGGNVFAAGQ